MLFRVTECLSMLLVTHKGQGFTFFTCLELFLSRSILFQVAVGHSAF